MSFRTFTGGAECKFLTLPWIHFNKKPWRVLKRLWTLFARNKLESCPNFQRRVVSGDPAMEILQTIETEDIDLVVMGTHGRKGLEHILMGSVAGNVVKRSHFPVMTVNPYNLK